MNSQTFTTDADISRALLMYVVNPSRGECPRLEITTPKGTFHMVSVEPPVLPKLDGDTLAFISFNGRQPIGRTETFMWPAEGVEEPARAITALSVYVQ